MKQFILILIFYIGLINVSFSQTNESIKENPYLIKRKQSKVHQTINNQDTSKIIKTRTYILKKQMENQTKKEVNYNKNKQTPLIRNKNN